MPGNDEWAKYGVWENDTLLKARADANNATNEMGLSKRIGDCYRLLDPCE